MASKTIIQYIDDLDNSELSGDDHTVAFGFERASYEIDLSENNAQKLENALAPFVAVARRVGGRPTSAAPSEIGPGREQLQAMRLWARKNGMKVADRGRVSRQIQEAYRRDSRD